MAAFARGYKRPTPRRELAEDLSGHKGPIGHCAFVRRRRYELAMITSSVSSENALGNRICGLALEIYEILFLIILNHAILFVRLRRRESAVAMLSQKPAPARRARPRRTESSAAQGASVADRRGRATGHASRGPTSHGRACSPSRARRSGPSVGLAAPAGRERNFSSPQILENKRNRVGTPPNPPVRRTPMQRPSRRTERSCDTASVPGVVRWKSARRRIRGCEIFLSATP